MDALYQDPELAAFYDWDNPWTADFDWFLSLVDGARSVLDLGCGTGSSRPRWRRGGPRWWASIRRRRCWRSRGRGMRGTG
jgi:hypothetical protein